MLGNFNSIANPAIADIAGALDIRQKRIDADEAKRKEIRVGQLVAEAIPGLRKDSPLYQLAQEDTQRFAFVAKAMGVPLNSGEQIQAMADDAHSIASIAKSDPEGSITYVQNLIEQRQQMGLDTSKLSAWVDLAKQDIGKATRAMDMTDKSLNGDLYRKRELEERELGQKDRALDIQEARNNVDRQQVVQGTADQKNWDQYQRLKESDPQAAEQFARATGFASTEGQKLSPFAEKEIANSSDEYNVAISSANRYKGLAEKLKQSALSGGLKSTWTEYVKEQTGNQDEITALRKEALAITNSEAINNLPPGPATDRDIELARAPFPTEKSSPEYVANWLGAVARLNEKKAEYAEFKADFIGKNGSVRTKDGNTLASAWKSSQKQRQADSPKDEPQPSSSSIDDLVKKYAK